jgi:hypothetical protein
MRKLANKLPKKKRGGVIVKKADKRDKRRAKPGNPKGKGGFAKGFSGNPNGRPKDTPEIKASRESVRSKFITTFEWLSNLPYDELNKIPKRKLTLMEGGMLQALKNHYKSGNYEWVRFPYEHVMGKAIQAVDIDTNGGAIVYNFNPDFMPKLNNAPDNKS